MPRYDVCHSFSAFSGHGFSWVLKSLALLRCLVNNMAAGGNEHGSRRRACAAHLLHIDERWLAYQYRSGGQPFEVPDSSAVAYPSPYSSQKIPISKTTLKIPFLESHPDLPGVNELKTGKSAMTWRYWTNGIELNYNDLWIRSVVPEADIKRLDMWLHPTDTVGCNYLSLPLLPASGKTVNQC